MISISNGEFQEFIAEKRNDLHVKRNRLEVVQELVSQEEWDVDERRIMPTIDHILFIAYMIADKRIKVSIIAQDDYSYGKNHTNKESNVWETREFRDMPAAYLYNIYFAESSLTIQTNSAPLLRTIKKRFDPFYHTYKVTKNNTTYLMRR